MNWDYLTLTINEDQRSSSGYASRISISISVIQSEKSKKEKNSYLDKLCNQAHLGHSRNKLWRGVSESGSGLRQVCIPSLLGQQRIVKKWLNDPNKNVYGMPRHVGVLRSV